MVGMAIIGKYLRGILILPQFLGLMLFAFVSDFLSKIKWLNFRECIEFTPTVYSGFHAHVVRAMLICCDYANSPEQVSWKHLFSESIGFSAFTNVFMSGSFILFNDWKQWKDGMHEFVWSGAFKVVPKKIVGKATVVRTLSINRFVQRILWIIFWVYFYKHFMFAVNLLKLMAPISDRILKDQCQISDWGILSYVTLMTVMRFNVFYAIFYNVSRLIGDFQQFLLSPAFSPEAEKLISGDEEAIKAWRKASIIEKLFRLEMETECLMPEGPCCTVCVETSSAIWRKFDTGLYNVLKHYVYIPWIMIVTKLLDRGATKEGQKLGPLANQFSPICGALFTFIFVLTFHRWTRGNQIWVMFSFTLWLMERMVIQCNRKYGMSDYLERRLSPAWERRIRFGACAMLQLVNMTSFYFFVTQFETGSFMMKTMIMYPCKLALYFFIRTYIVERRA
nr:membrane bound acyltransferase:hhat [Hymenolepis microstoma]